MKRIATIVAAILTFAATAAAQSQQLTLGYCDGEVSTDLNDNFSSKQKDQWISAAIYIPASKVKTFSGCQIDTIRAGLASKLKIDSMRVWIRQTLQGDELASGGLSKTTDQRMKNEWNAVPLEHPYRIDEQSGGLYIGYTFHQVAASYGLSVINTPRTNALFVKIGNSEWQDRSDEGTLCIEATVGGENLPRLNLELASVSVQPVYVVGKNELSVEATIRNVATETVSAYDMACLIAGQTLRTTIAQPIKGGETQTAQATFSIGSIVTAKPDDPQMPITITIDNLSEGDDEDTADNSLDATFTVVDRDYQRYVLIEEFTTESCPNCPRVANYLSNALAKPEFAQSVLTIEHHSGYYTDWLTTEADRDYLWFYNAGGGTYAPAVMFDRYSYGLPTPVMSLGSQDELEEGIRSRMGETAYVGLTIDATITDDSKLDVTVSGERSISNLTTTPARLTLFLVEDNIVAQGQAGATGSFVHHNVLRDVNSTWGDEISWTDNQFTHTHSFALRGSYEAENLKLIAIVADYDADDPSACTIANAAQTVYADFHTASAIRSTSLDAATSAEYYSLDGRRLARPTKGIVINKTSTERRKCIF